MSMLLRQRLGILRWISLLVLAVGQGRQTYGTIAFRWLASVMFMLWGILALAFLVFVFTPVPVLVVVRMLGCGIFLLVPMEIMQIKWCFLLRPPYRKDEVSS
jgi:hypothetical protein